MPFLIIALVGLFFMTVLLVVVPMAILITATNNLFVLPRHIWRVATNRRLRQNHALEHATLNVLAERAMEPVDGFSREDGFFVRGLLSDHDVLSAATEGLERLQNGEHRLAIHPRCGTSRAVGSLLASVAAILVLLGWGRLDLWTVLLAVVAIGLATPPMARLAQRFLTTDSRMGEVAILDVHWAPRGPALMSQLALGRAPMESFFVETGIVGTVRVESSRRLS